VVHACNPSYAEDRDQVRSQPGQIVRETQSQKKPITKKKKKKLHKKGLAEWLKH
jgi:hypothetical protein